MKERAQPENGPADDRRKASPPGRARPGARAAEPRAPQPVTPEPVADAPGWYVVRRPDPEPSADRKRFDDALFDQPLFDEPLLDQPLVDEPPPPEVPAAGPGWSIARVLGAAMVALALLAFGIALIDAYLLEPPSGDGATARPIAAMQPPPASSPQSDPAGMEPRATAARPAGGERAAAAAAPADLAPEKVAPEDVEPTATARDPAPEIAAEPPPQDGPGVPRAEAASSPATGPPETGREAAAALERLIAERRRGGPDGAQAAPGASDTRVFLHYAGADLANADLARRLAEHLRRQGLTVADIRTVDFPIEQPSVRFFFEGDQSAGQRLVETLAGFLDGAPSQVPERASDFTHHTPKPRPGSLEIWLRDS